MKYTHERPTVVIFEDAVDVDNFALTYAATHPNIGFNARAVIVNSRPIYTGDGEYDADTSNHLLSSHAERMAGFLARADRNVPVFEGLIAPYSPVPNHFDESIMDLYGDSGSGKVSGTIHDAVEYLKQTDGLLHNIVGGPMTELDYMMQVPELDGRFGILTTQLGRLSRNLFNLHLKDDTNHQFNSACDPEAAARVWRDYPGPIASLTKDATKHPSVGFLNADELAFLGVAPELVELYRVSQPYLQNKSDGLLYMHDFHPAMAMDGYARYLENFDAPNRLATQAIVHSLEHPNGYRTTPYREAWRLEFGKAADGSLLQTTNHEMGTGARKIIDSIVGPSQHLAFLQTYLSNPSVAPLKYGSNESTDSYWSHAHEQDPRIEKSDSVEKTVKDFFKTLPNTEHTEQIQASLETYVSGVIESSQRDSFDLLSVLQRIYDELESSTAVPAGSELDIIHSACKKIYQSGPANPDASRRIVAARMQLTGSVAIKKAAGNVVEFNTLLQTLGDDNYFRQ